MGPSRPLTSGEIAMARSVFGETIDYPRGNWSAPNGGRSSRAASSWRRAATFTSTRADTNWVGRTSARPNGRCRASSFTR
jgi:hypothetical protein